MQPVTQQFSLSWKPEVRFFERRLDPLRTLDAKSKVHSFRVQQTDITIYIDDPYQEIRYGSTGISLRLADPETDGEQTFAAVQEVFRIFEPQRLGLARANLQFLEKLSGGYDELRASWGDRLLTPPSGISLSDWAVLVNPDIDDAKPPWAGALEFGIVAGDEAEGRLARTFGKLVDEPVGDVSDRIEFPEVAFFADSHCATTSAIGDTGEGLFQASLVAWNTISQKISELATRIKDEYAGAMDK